MWRELKQRVFDGLQKCFGGSGGGSGSTSGGRGKGVKTVGNAAVVSGCPSAPLTAAHGGGGGSKMAAANMKAATRGGPGGGTKSSPLVRGGGLFIGAKAAIVGRIDAAY